MIRYQNAATHLTADQLEGFFVGWPDPPSSATLVNLLHASFRCVVAIDSASDKVVGFIYAISDGILSAYIPLLEVLPDFQQQSIGTELVRRLIAELKSLYMIDVVCDADVQRFYQKAGFQTAAAMVRRNYGAQSGS